MNYQTASNILTGVCIATPIVFAGLWIAAMVFCRRTSDSSMVKYINNGG